MTNLALHHKVNSKESGAGKSYLTKKVASYFPSKRLMILSGVTDKAFFYMKGERVVKGEGERKGEKPEFIPINTLIADLKLRRAEMEDKGKLTKAEAQKIDSEIERLNEKSFRLIDLRFTDIILADTPQEGLLNAIMSILSQDSETADYMYTDKNKMESTKNIIIGSPEFIYTRVIDDTKNPRAEEVFRRFVNVTPNVTQQKIQTANELTLMKMGTLPEQYDRFVVSSEDKRKAKDIVSRLVDKLVAHSQSLGFKESGIIIPFITTLAKILPSDQVFMMTEADRLVRYLSVVTKAAMDSRPRFVHRQTGAIYPISTFDDLKETFGLMESAGGNIRSYLSVWYNTVLVPFCDILEKPGEDVQEYSSGGITIDRREVIAKQTRKGRTVPELIEQTKLILGFTPSRTEMQSKYLTPMVNLGLINWEKNVKRGNEHIYFPADEDKKQVFTLFPDCDSNDLKLVVRDSSIYPSENVLENDYGLNSILMKRGVGVGEMETEQEKNILDVYRLEDQEGNQITVSELIDRYLSNPELCFTVRWEEMKAYDGELPTTSSPSPSIAYGLQILTNHLHNCNNNS